MMATRPQPKTIRLGDKSWTIRPFTLRQVELLEPVVAEGADSGSTAYGLAVLEIALSRDHAGEFEAVRDIEATASELAAATRDLLTLAGYLEEPGARGTAAGEADAAQGAASTSTISTDASPPPPDGTWNESEI